MDTDFYGNFVLNRPLTPEHRMVLEEFAEEEHDRVGADGMPPTTYCQWRPTENGTGLEWDGIEKFYYYGEWLEYLVSHFLKSWGYTLNGTVRYDGWTEGVTGTIQVTDNEVVVTREEVDPNEVEAWWDARS